MLIYPKLSGKWDPEKRRYVFPVGQERVVYRGRAAFAFGGGGGSSSQVVATGPWESQVPYVNALFDQAMQLYRQGPPSYYPERLTAPINPTLANSWGNTNVEVIQNSQVNDAVQQSLVQSANSAGANPVNQVAGQLTPGLTRGVQTLMGGGNDALRAGMTLRPQMVQAVQGASSAAPQSTFGQVDPSGALNTALNSNGLNPYTDQIVDAALRQSNEQFASNVLPAIRTEAGNANQVGGTRHGIAEGLAARALVNQQGDVMSRLYGQAFDVGSQDRNNALALVSQGQQANQSAALTQRGQALQGAQLTGNLLTQGSDLSQQATSTGTAQAGQLLMGGNNAAIDQYYRSLGLIPQIQANQMAQLGFQNQSGLQQYGINQAGIDAEIDRYFYNQLAPYNALTQFQNYISGAYGSSLPSESFQTYMPNGFPRNTPPPSPRGQTQFPQADTRPVMRTGFQTIV